MDRQRIRELIRQAQAAEVAGEPRLAASLLAQAATIHLDGAEAQRAATLLRHGLRLQPHRADLQELLARAAPGEPLEPELVPDEPIEVVPVHDLPEVATVRTLAEEPLHLHVVSAELPETDAPGDPRGLSLPERGPVHAESDANCWCSFCCRPKSEVGEMAAGPAGAFICSHCLRTSAGLLGAPVQPVPAPPPASNRPEATRQPVVETAQDFVEAAVILSKQLGWSLSEVRSLGPDELGRALAKLQELETPRNASKRRTKRPPGKPKRAARRKR